MAGGEGQLDGHQSHGGRHALDVGSSAAMGYGKVLKTDSVLGTTTGMVGTDGDDPDDYNHQPFRGSMSWYKPDLFLGSHDIKVGGEYMRAPLGPPAASRAAETWRSAQEIHRRRRARQLRLRQLPAAVPATAWPTA